MRDSEDTCGIAQAAAVVGDWWNLLVLREVARGHRRFDELVAELGISRKVLTERLLYLVDHGVLSRRQYQGGPPRYDYVLTDRGQALLPVLVAMQDWADRWLLGDGSLTATAGTGDARRLAALPGTAVPGGVTLPGADGRTHDVIGSGAATVVFTYPGTGGGKGFGDIPGVAGCTLENRLYRDAWPQFDAAGIAVHGVSTQRIDEQAAFAAAERVPYPLLSDVDLEFAAALRLPTFRAAQQLRLKRLVLVVDRDRVVRDVVYPVTDIPAAVRHSLDRARTLVG